MCQLKHNNPQDLGWRNKFHSKNTYFLSNADNGGASRWVGDGFCDDMNNNEVCNYDSGDCCGLSIKKNFCVDCICKGNSNNFKLLNKLVQSLFSLSIYM